MAGTCLQFLALQLKVKTMPPLFANEEDHKVPMDKPPSDCEDKKVRTDKNDKEVQQDDLKKMGGVKEIAEFFNRIPKRNAKNFLLQCVKLSAQLLREHHITSLLHMAFPSTAKAKMITSTKSYRT
jgi:hypothetical protein